MNTRSRKANQEKVQRKPNLAKFKAPAIKKAKNEENTERRFNVTKFPPFGIPKHALTRTLEIVNDPNDEFWLNKNSSCAPPINDIVYGGGVQRSETYIKLNLARKCLLTRDFHNLAKLLTSNIIGDTVMQKSSFPIFTDYASILLTLKDPELLQKLKATISNSSTQSANKSLQLNSTSTEKDNTIS
ncbi:uncharacterized protein LOC117564690 [Drosophila albomicans]|uniref:Uncharacterized protein LOC117564690 n=1 Tax=Drosophila albomicans TaxID=7291 RepID=A0A6P8W747_DROAB|nr:uncharacterized protein LOC117564690 [Drosophila albomicans]